MIPKIRQSRTIVIRKDMGSKNIRGTIKLSREIPPRIDIHIIFPSYSQNQVKDLNRYPPNQDIRMIAKGIRDEFIGILIRQGFKVPPNLVIEENNENQNH